jgi:ribosome recycling factor
MNENPVVKQTVANMQKAVAHTLHEFSTIHTGKASPTMVEGVMVDAYGSQMRLKEVAAITTPDARLIQVQPWDRSMLKPIEKAIQMANIGINPSIDGSVIRLPMPDLSRERRLDMVKVAHRMAEEGRVAVRHARRDGIEAAKRLQKDGKASEDEVKRLEKDIQNHTDRLIKEIADHLAAKEKELLTV